ncbi:zinc finger protein OZF [Bombyx mori]|uniref:zinc finger protein OZF n=1 Tax=Bombyx mori TaxID=7091 RepID=UPI002ED1EF56
MSWKRLYLNSDKYTYEYFRQGKVCRICWQTNASKEITNICDKDVKISLLDKIVYCLNIKLLPWPDINGICDECCNEIEQFYEFKTFCSKADNKLQEIYKIGFEAKRQADIKIETNDFLNLESPHLDSDFEENHRPVTEKKVKKIRMKHKAPHSSSYCTLCLLDMESVEKLKSHKAEAHGIELDGTFKCFGCEKKCKTWKTRQSHEIYFCKGLKDGFKCSICNRYLPKRRTYEAHIRDHIHNRKIKLPEKLFKCNKCLQCFKTKQSLTEHSEEHQETKKNFVCDACGRVFSRQDYLHKHKLTHTGVRRYGCPHCNFKATQRSSLTVHIRKHTGEKPYSCDVCPQRCISSSNLRAHRRRHLGLKKFECPICNKKFGYKTSLEEHVSSNHGRTEQHTCDHCSATYSRKRGLQRHLAAKHAKQNGAAMESEPNPQDNKNVMKGYDLKMEKFCW